MTLENEYLQTTVGVADVLDQSACEKCTHLLLLGQPVLVDEYGSLFCGADCAEAWEQDRAEEANEARQSGEGGTTQAERRDQMAGWLKGRR